MPQIVEILQFTGTGPGLWVVLLVLMVSGMTRLLVGRVRDLQRHFMTQMVLRESKPGNGTVIRIIDEGRWWRASAYSIEVDSDPFEPNVPAMPDQEGEIQ
ncbi:hypothetical protein K7711_46015 [Nocardia sp. CA2R105]|uniref:hypothetical protein n=1 Tax=Nocardia coffeae TaxID=2873381 RepID=UPI001CA77D6E|nr:hypothetical protein [Nocardia coffeae]MBY8863888.1 hypothetical protein [Nocardia coffeae]